MKKAIQIILLLGVMLTALPLSASAASTAYPFFGPQGADDDFVWFGDTTYPYTSEEGILLTVDETSISFQSVIANVRFDEDYISSRKVTRFYITANNRIVDWFDPARDPVTGNDKRSYDIRIRFDSWNTGSFVNLRVVAISDGEVQGPGSNLGSTHRYVVGWSNQPGGFILKDMPVYDEVAVTWLQAIFNKLKDLMMSMEMRLDAMSQMLSNKLDDLQNMLASKLSQINMSIREIYEVKPETQAKFDSAMAELQAKLPTEQMKDQVNEVQKVIEDSSNRINNTTQVVKYGEIHWMGVVVTPAVDFTLYMDEIKKIRRLLQIILWCEFFYAIILILRPRLTV
ncbi:hypothetical protein GC101_22010 [Paenibacillus sp. LMG 31459]|uniref:Uncharacterized protein n=1 Tax=Paenibacillus phytohabitans TaxID=2654978 RepID=A0ABX1YNN5_9BACL|nr:OmpH family outer membrane protein [Paenibacillus phytohabitans]NOU81541.1 hypothetical protein [Paenibacillus phytohabitans]